MVDKKADLAGPGIGTYAEVEKALPRDYVPILDPKDTQIALAKVKRFIEDGLNRELNLIRVEVPLIVSKESGVNDYLDRDGSRTPIDFHCGLGLAKPLEAQVVQAATKWKRMALRQFSCEVGQGINTDMRAVRKDYFLTMTTAATSTSGTGSAASQPRTAASTISRRLSGRSGASSTTLTSTSVGSFRSLLGRHFRAYRKSWSLFTLRIFSGSTRTCRASSARRQYSRTTQRSS